MVALQHLLHQRRPTPLEIDDTIAKAHAALACTLCQCDWDWTGAESHFKRAIELDPRGDDGLHGYALYLSSAGRHIEAIRTIKRAEELDPLVLPFKANIGLIYLMARQYERAIEQLQRVVEFTPDAPSRHAILGRAYVFAGRHEEGISEFRKALELSGCTPPYRAEMAWGLEMMGKTVETESILKELIERPPQREMGGGASNMARIYAALGDADSAFEWLDKALDQKNTVVPFLGVNPDLDSLRSDPRF